VCVCVCVCVPAIANFSVKFLLQTISYSHDEQNNLLALVLASFCLKLVYITTICYSILIKVLKK